MDYHHFPNKKKAMNAMKWLFPIFEFPNFECLKTWGHPWNPWRRILCLQQNDVAHPLLWDVRYPDRGVKGRTETAGGKTRKDRIWHDMGGEVWVKIENTNLKTKSYAEQVMDVQWFCGIKYLPKPMANLRYPPNQFNVSLGISFTMRG